MLSKFVDEKFPKWAKILLCIFGCASGVYRIFNFVDDCIANKQDKHVLALVIGILCIVPPISFVLGFVLAIIDIISIAQHNEFSTVLR